MRRLSIILAWFGCVLLSDHALQAQSPASEADVRKFPWLDASLDFGDNVVVTFAAGRYTELDDDGRCRVCNWIVQLRFGDVDRDGREEALIILGDNVGGAGTWLSGYVFALEHGGPVLRAKVEGGDRADQGLQSLRVDRGDLVVTRYVDDVGLCCPRRIETQRWRWIDGALVKHGPARFDPWPSGTWRQLRRRTPKAPKACPDKKSNTRGASRCLDDDKPGDPNEF